MVKFLPNQRYLKIKNRVHIWTPVLAKREDAKEFFPDFGPKKKPKITPVETDAPPAGDGPFSEEYLMTMTKHALEKHALETYEVDLDKRERKEVLVSQILDLQKKVAEV